MASQKKMTNEKCKMCGKADENCICDLKENCNTCGKNECCCGKNGCCVRKCWKGRCARWIACLFIAFCFLVGLLGGGHFIGNGLKTAFHKNDRTIKVAVKVEKKAKADQALWSISFQATGTDIAALEEKYSSDRDIILSFLKDKGFKEEELDVKGPTIEDQYAGQNYGNTDASKLPSSARYVMNSKVRVTTSNLNALGNAMKNTGELVKKGIILTQKQFSINPKYYVKETGEIEKELYGEAIQKAISAAEKIATGMGVTLGSLHSLKQAAPIDDKSAEQPWNQTSGFQGAEKMLNLEIQAEYDIK